MVVVGSVYEKNKIIKDPDQEIYAHHFDREYPKVCVNLQTDVR